MYVITSIYIIWNTPGQLLGLHRLSALMTPEQPTPPGQVRCLLEIPPPQLLLQLLQDSQLDHVTSSAIHDIREGGQKTGKSLVFYQINTTSNKTHLDMCYSHKVLFQLYLQSILLHQCMCDVCWLFLHHSSYCSCSKVPSWTIWPQLEQLIRVV